MICLFPSHVIQFHTVNWQTFAPFFARVGFFLHEHTFILCPISFKMFSDLARLNGKRICYAHARTSHFCFFCLVIKPTRNYFSCWNWMPLSLFISHYSWYNFLLSIQITAHNSLWKKLNDNLNTCHMDFHAKFVVERLLLWD